MVQSEVERVCEVVRKNIENFKKSESCSERSKLLDSVVDYLKGRLGDRYKQFLGFIFPGYEGEYIPAGFVVFSENLPEKLKEFLEQQTAP